MRELTVLMNVMPPCLCESKVIGYERNEDGLNITHCVCGGLISFTESEDVEVKKPFDITKHEFSDTGIECCEIGGGVLTIHNPELTTNLLFEDAIAIVKAFGVTGEDLK